MNIVTNQTHKYYGVDLQNRIISQPTYMFAGYDSPVLADTTDSVSDVFNNIMFAKKVNPSDTIMMIDRFDWASGSVYSGYDANNPVQCIINVSQGSNWGVYKCLFSPGTPSTVQPSGTNTLPVTLSDGYIWKYLFQVDSATFTKFATTTAIPFIEDANTTAAAIHHSVDVITVSDGGRGYTNWFKNSFSSSAFTGNTQQFVIDNSASAISNTYVGCILVIANGSSGAVGEYRTITSYSANGTTKTIAIDSPFTSLPAVNDSYEIFPSVTFVASHGSYPVARAIVDPLSTSVTRVEVLSPGADLYDVTATVQASSVVGVVRPASLVAQVSPALGHGGSVLTEALNVSLGISTTFNDNPLPVGNQIQSIGLITNVLASNVAIAIANNASSQYANGESFVQFNTVGQIATTTMTGNVLTSNAGFTAVRAGDWLNIGGKIVAQISSVTNTSYATATTSAFTVTTGNTSYIRLVSSGKINKTNATHIIVSGSPVYSNTTVFGITSKVSAIAGAVTISGRVANNFNSLNGTQVLVGAVTGNVAPNSVITQGNVSATVVTSNTTGIYVINPIGSFANGVAVTSGGSITITDKYSKDLISGDLLYVETTQPITRQVNKPETIKLVLGTS